MSSFQASQATGCRTRWTEVLCLLLLTLAAFGVRLYRVGSISLAEDEAGKWLAIQQYQRGMFVGVNSEHPMLMKLLAWGSVGIGQRWNHWAGNRRWLVAREEAWLRMPNLVLGAATVVVIYLLGNRMFGSAGAGAAALFWAITPLPIALNRILKEDTLVTFFTCLAFYFFWRAKQTSDDSFAGRLFAWSGACFGLALASKYLIHYMGLNLVAWHVAGSKRLDRRLFLPFAGRFFLAMGLVFVLLNPVILSPTNDRLILDYMGEKEIAHHGYNLDGRLYMNNIGNTPFGLPWYFYFWVLVVKTPLPVLAAFLAGIILILFERNTSATIFLRVMLVFWFIPYSLAGTKFVRYVLIVLPFVFLTGGYAVQRLYDWVVRERVPGFRRWGFALGVPVLCLLPALEMLAWAPLYPLYLNPLGGGRANAAKLFPHDELYDLGVGEAVEYTCRAAPPEAVLGASNPMAVGYYLHRCGRGDIHVAALYDLDYVPRPGDILLVQESRRYFETEGLFRLVERRGPPLKQVYVDGVPTSRIYRF